MHKSSVAMVYISAAETVLRIWSGSDQKGLGQTKKSRSDPNVLVPTGSGSIMNQNFLKINIIFRIFWPKILVGGVGNIANLTGLRFLQSVANVHSDI
jgi:hypothetical protein